MTDSTDEALAQEAREDTAETARLEREADAGWTCADERMAAAETLLKAELQDNLCAYLEDGDTLQDAVAFCMENVQREYSNAFNAVDYERLCTRISEALNDYLNGSVQADPWNHIFKD